MTNLQSVVSGPRAIRLGTFFSQHTPERVGHRLAWWAAGAVCQLKPAVYHIVQANLGQVLGAGADPKALERARASCKPARSASCR